MSVFQVLETEKFRSDLEEAAFWLYSHNLEQSEEFADLKFVELQQEIDGLKNHLVKTPQMGQVDPISGLRRFPLYAGRYIVTWIANEAAQTVILLEFIDSKYPKPLRQFKIDE